MLTGIYMRVCKFKYFQQSNYVVISLFIDMAAQYIIIHYCYDQTYCSIPSQNGIHKKFQYFMTMFIVQ